MPSRTRAGLSCSVPSIMRYSLLCCRCTVAGSRFGAAPDGSAKIDVDLASLKSIIETKKTQLVSDKEVAFRMLYRQAAGECDVEATHLVDSNISITAGYALHAQQARVKEKST